MEELLALVEGWELSENKERIASDVAAFVNFHPAIMGRFEQCRACGTLTYIGAFPGFCQGPGHQSLNSTCDLSPLDPTPPSEPLELYAFARALCSLLHTRPEYELDFPVVGQGERPQWGGWVPVVNL